MLSGAPVGPGLPASDFERARTFYAQTLGLALVDGVATFGPNKVAYFTDTEGNILSLAQVG